MSGYSGLCRGAPRRSPSGRMTMLVVHIIGDTEVVVASFVKDSKGRIPVFQTMSLPLAPRRGVTWESNG